MLLIGRNQSPFTRRVAITMHMLNMEFERRALTAWQNLEEVRRYNPVGRVPSLILDDGEVLFDSTAILDYLNELAGPENALVPPAGVDRRQVQRLVGCALGVTEKALHIRYEQIRRPNEKIHQPWLDHNEGQVTSGLKWLEGEILSPWSHGARVTQADVTIVVMYDFIATTNKHLLPDDQYPKLKSLVSRAYEIDAVRRTDPSQ